MQLDPPRTKTYALRRGYGNAVKTFSKGINYMQVKAKYNNKKTVVDGITFDSMREAKRYSELKLLERGNCISDLRLQVSYELIPAQTGGLRKELPTKYIADFVYFDNELNKTIIADTKGVKTKDYVIKRKLMKFMGYEITEV